MFTYKVETLWNYPPAMPRAMFTVVQYEDGVAKGGDHHWLLMDSALRALAVYEHDDHWFGKPATEVLTRFAMGWPQA